MTLAFKARRISETPGIEAVVVWRPGARADFGAPKWHDILAASIDLLAVAINPHAPMANKKFIRLYVGKHTIVVQREGEEIIAAVLLTGHPANKSLRRTIRRAAR